MTSRPVVPSGPPIPFATPPFPGVTGRLVGESEPSRPEVPLPSADAPNIVLVLLDDVGFGTCGTFGGPVPTPALDRVAANGLRFNQFHTTALCSPTRAAMLTGRNHHAVHMGNIPEGASGFPGYDCIIPKEAATVAEILRQYGYSTGAFGKWHVTPAHEQTLTGPFDRWPTGLGFERFYGILSAEASQFEPPMFDQTVPVMPYEGRDDYHMSEDITEKAIAWMRLQRASNPHRPFFTYLATGAMHCPHHVWPSYIERFRGQFDDGWDALRARIHARQLELGVIPSGTVLTPRPAEVPSWEEYPDRYKPVASRLMEVFAGFMAHTDEQVGRLLDALDEMGETDNTLFIYVTGDNGASAEGTINGAWSAPSFQNGIPEDPEWILDHIDDLGSARCENHFNLAWAWALDSPFQWMKQIASHFGGTRNAMAVQWPRRIKDAGALRSNFHHVTDIFATLLDAAGIEAPSHVNGLAQMPIDGVSMVPVMESASAPENHVTQYFEMFGNRAIYHDGWIASCFHGRLPWKRFDSVPFDGPQEKWELYDIRNDFSQGRDLAAERPDKLAELQQLFDEEARRNNVYPLKEPGQTFGAKFAVHDSLRGTTKMTYTAAHQRMPERSVVNLKNCSFRITADITVPVGGCEGVIAAQGGNMAGWSLYVGPDGRPRYHYNWLGHEHYVAVSGTALAPGRHTVVIEHAYDGGMGGGGDSVMSLDGVPVGHVRVEKSVPVIFSISGETFDVGMDSGAAVGDYPHVYRFNGTIHGVTLERLSEPPPEVRALIEDAEFRASLAVQ
ncbi:MAG: arylsulfatase [Actinobacteria bacterium]|nr:arylsulfatase [Actinomycetota bacterium]